MPAYLVTYRLPRPVQNYAGLYKYLDAHPSTEVGTSSRVILSSKTAEEIRKDLGTFLDTNDHFYVFGLSGWYSGFGPTDVNNWLHANIRVGG
jgi:hypothetical protein